MPKNALARLKDTKIRALLILGAAVVITLSILLYFTLKKPTPPLTEASVAGKVPDISAIPGGATSERYQQLLEEENRKRAESARKAGTSAIATIIGGRKKEGSETFGIEGQLLAKQGCSCPPAAPGETPDLDPARAAQLIAELRKNPERALELLKQNPGLGKALCKKDPNLALQTMEKDMEAAKIILSECPDIAKAFAEKNPELFKKLMLANPALARQLAEKNPELFKQLMESDPEFAKQLVNQNPDLVKTLMKNDPDFAEKIAKAHPDLVKDLMRNDPAFAETLGKNNPALVKELMSNDPEFAKLMAQKSPGMVKDLMISDPAFAETLAKNNPTLVKELMKNDPAFAKQMTTTNPNLVKKLVLSDPEFAKMMIKNNPDAIKDLMTSDPAFAQTLAQNNPTLLKELMKNDPAFAKQLAKTSPDLVKKLILDDPEFAKMMAKNNPEMVDELMRNDPNFAKALEQKNPGISALIKSQLASNKAAPVFRQTPGQNEAQRRQQAALEATKLQQLSEQQQKQKDSLRANMDKQANSITQGWNEYTAQVLVPGEWKDKEKENKEGATAMGGPGAGPDGAASNAGGSTTAPLFKAGTILFAVLDTAVNSDEPGPVLATIVDGQYRGAKLLGSVTKTAQPGNQPPEKVTINFNTINITNRSNSLSIQAVAIDPDTARTAIATDVDHHYLMRYGTLLASSFITGYAKVLTSQGTVQTSSANGLSTTTTTPPLNHKDKVYAALGEVGNKLGQATASWFDTPPTITVEAGTGVGILFLTDVNG